jgi:hypothetical protein
MKNFQFKNLAVFILVLAKSQIATASAAKDEETKQNETSKYFHFMADETQRFQNARKQVKKSFSKECKGLPANSYMQCFTDKVSKIVPRSSKFMTTYMAILTDFKKMEMNKGATKASTDAKFVQLGVATFKASNVDSLYSSKIATNDKNEEEVKSIQETDVETLNKTLEKFQSTCRAVVEPYLNSGNRTTASGENHEKAVNYKDLAKEIDSLRIK